MSLKEKKLICFIDDSAEERELFQQVFGAEEGRFRVLCAETFQEALEEIEKEGVVPDLFVLDLYFPSSESHRQKKVLCIGPITLPDDEGDLLKAFMNAETAQNRYREIRAAEGQSPAGGLRLIEQVQEAFTGTPIISYTRKGRIEEAESARRRGARRVLQKPSGKDWEETLRLTLALREELERQFLRVIGRDPFEMLNLILHEAKHLDSPEHLRVIADEIARLRKKLLKSLDAEISQDDVDRLMMSTNHPFLRALIHQLGQG